MAPGGDWLARKLLGSDLVEEMDRRNSAAEGAFIGAGKKPQYGRHAPLSSHYSESPRESKIRGGIDCQDFAYAGSIPVPSYGHVSHHQGVGMRGGKSQPTQYSEDSPMPSRYTEGRTSQRHASRPQEIPLRGGYALQPTQYGEHPSSPRHTEGRSSQRHMTRPQEQPTRTHNESRPSRAADGGYSHDLLVNPYGITNGAADSNRSVNYTPQQPSHAIAASHRRVSGRQSYQPGPQAGEEGFYKGHKITEVTPGYSHHNAIPSPLSRRPDAVNTRSSRHSAAPSVRSRQPEGVHRSGSARYPDGYDDRNASHPGDFY
ncbi:MAG: hypothetical protein Q9216_006746 [Gyalolechia sp. 2 TL-2023]